jgi:hypothetical protein
MNIILRSWPDPGALSLKGDFRRFESRQGIEGLMRLTHGDREIELLAVRATQPGTGQFRRFIAACQTKFDRVAIWNVWNGELPAILQRYGFTPCEQTEADGEKMEGLAWRREA